MKRKFYDAMLEWKRTSNGRTALMIDGARRVGKSYIAEEFAKREYDRFPARQVDAHAEAQCLARRGQKRIECHACLLGQVQEQVQVKPRGGVSAFGSRCQSGSGHHLSSALHGILACEGMTRRSPIA